MRNPIRITFDGPMAYNGLWLPTKFGVAIQIIVWLIIKKPFQMAFPMLNSNDDSGSDPEQIKNIFGVLVGIGTLCSPYKFQFASLSIIEVMIFWNLPHVKR